MEGRREEGARASLRGREWRRQALMTQSMGQPVPRITTTPLARNIFGMAPTCTANGGVDNSVGRILSLGNGGRRKGFTSRLVLFISVCARPGLHGIELALHSWKRAVSA